MVFDLTKTPEQNQTIDIYYPKLNVINISNNNGDFISGTYFNNSSTPNVTHTINSIKNTYKAKEIRVYGPLFPGISVNYNATLVIKNSKDTNSQDLYMCFLLNTNRVSQPTEIDKLLTATQPTVEIDIDAAIDRNTGTDQYIAYDTKNYMGECRVMIYTSPIRIVTPTDSFISTTDWFPDISTDKAATNMVLNSVNASDQPWMVCENVDIGAEEVTTYNLNIDSSILKQSATMDSFKTIMMFIVFLFICAFSYMIIPSVYLMMIKRIMERSKPAGMDVKQFVFLVDIFISILLGLTGFILICFGAFSKPGEVENQGDVLLAGFVISIIYIISYIVIQSKKMTGPFVPGVDYVNDISSGSSGSSQLIGASMNVPGANRMVPSQLSSNNRFSGGPGRM
jgi:hypothetical protein